MSVRFENENPLYGNERAAVAKDNCEINCLRLIVFIMVTRFCLTVTNDKDWPRNVIMSVYIFFSSYCSSKETDTLPLPSAVASPVGSSTRPSFV